MDAARGLHRRLLQLQDRCVVVRNPPVGGLLHGLHTVPVLRQPASDGDGVEWRSPQTATQLPRSRVRHAINYFQIKSLKHV